MCTSMYECLCPLGAEEEEGDATEASGVRN